MDALMHRSFVALTPQDVPAAQQGIAQWCRQKIAVLGVELSEQRTNLRQAKAAKWKHSSWATAAKRTKDRMIYYAKIMAAVKAGYLVVPNFEVEVMAVRVNRDNPPATHEIGTGSYSSASNTLVRAKPDLLPPGVGRYVDDRMFYSDEQYSAKDKQGNDVEKHRYQVTGYDVPDFPVRTIKPVVLDATQRAMSLRIFDSIGVVTGRKKDPLVIGEIIDPSSHRSWLPSQQKRVSFFIAWWLNTEDL